MGFLEVKDLATITGRSPGTVRNWCYFGLIRHHHRGGSHARIRFALADVEAFLAKRIASGRPFLRTSEKAKTRSRDVSTAIPVQARSGDSEPSDDPR